VVPDDVLATAASDCAEILRQAETAADAVYSPAKLVTCVSGFSTICFGVFLLQYSQAASASDGAAAEDSSDAATRLETQFGMPGPAAIQLEVLHANGGDDDDDDNYTRSDRRRLLQSGS